MALGQCSSRDAHTHLPGPGAPGQRCSHTSFNLKTSQETEGISLALQRGSGVSVAACSSTPWGTYRTRDTASLTLRDGGSGVCSGQRPATLATGQPEGSAEARLYTGGAGLVSCGEANTVALTHSLLPLDQRRAGWGRSSMSCPPSHGAGAIGHVQGRPPQAHTGASAALTGHGDAGSNPTSGPC